MSSASRVPTPGVRYLPIFNGRKRRIRGSWQRNSSFVARLSTETPDGRKKLLRLDQNRRSRVVAGLEELKRAKAAPRTRNLYAISLRNLFKYEISLGHLASSPADGISWLRPYERGRHPIPLPASGSPFAQNSPNAQASLRRGGPCLMPPTRPGTATRPGLRRLPATPSAWPCSF